MSWIWIVFWLVILINTTFAVITVFRKPRDIAATWAWLLVLVLLPVVGFLLYLFTGRGLGQTKIYNIQVQDKVGLQELYDYQTDDNLTISRSDSDIITDHASEIIQFFRTTDNAPLTKRNHVDFFIDGNDLFKAMFEDIDAAQESVHVEFYTIYDDNIGNEFLDHLERKAAEGVEVRVLYDAFGSHGTKPSWFKRLRELGGEAVTFITSKDVITKTRLNYHCHRKNVVIDGRIGYTGGFNVGDQYLGRKKKFGHWRDTHLRMTGLGVLALQIHFLMDWNASVKPPQHVQYQMKYFPKPKEDALGTTSLQVVTSGPDSTKEQIKNGYIKMFSMAKRRIWAQTPYLVPDDSVISTLCIAAAAGVDVRIMIPDMPDHPFIYRATQYYAQYLLEHGVKIYIYKDGFIHAKTVVIDDELASVGSANQDIRSYKLNFEINTFMYDRQVVSELADIYENDLKVCQQLTFAMVTQDSHWLHFKQRFSRLLSPIL